MIQEIAPAVFQNAFQNRPPRPEDPVLYFQNDCLCAACSMAGDQMTLRLPAASCLSSAVELTYAFKIDETFYYLVTSSQDLQLDPSFAFYSLSELRSFPFKGNLPLFLVYSAYHLHKWYRSAQYCGACGSVTEPSDTERAKVCPKCQHIIYPRINPAVIVGVIHEEKLLVTRYNRGFAQNALVAGFAEFGETLEECVRREVKEETGLLVKEITYYKSQPWGSALDLLMGFYCKVEGDPSIRIDQKELKFAAFLSPEEIELQSTDYSLTNEMMRMFKEGKIR